MNTSMGAPVPDYTPRFSLQGGATIVSHVVATILGAVFLLIGLCGFFVPDLLGAHLSPAHNWIHLVSGAIALCFGLVGTLGAVRAFNIAFGAIYGLLGVAGFLLGTPGTASVGHAASDNRLWALMPGVLELGGVDHAIHMLVGALFLIGGIVGYCARPNALDRTVG